MPPGLPRPPIDDREHCRGTGGQGPGIRPDLRARGIGDSELIGAVEVLEDLEGSFVEETMERADRVIAW